LNFPIASLLPLSLSLASFNIKMRKNKIIPSSFPFSPHKKIRESGQGVKKDISAEFLSKVCHFPSCYPIWGTGRSLGFCIRVLGFWGGHLHSIYI
jgi:hypothetical protein